MLLPDPTGQLLLENAVVVPPGSKLRVVKNLSIQIDAGDSVAVIGPSGAAMVIMPTHHLVLVGPGFLLDRVVENQDPVFALYLPDRRFHLSP
jgi:hypothetical protein